MTKEKDYHLHDPTWCPGCGIYSIFAAMKKMAAMLNLPPEELVVVTGIGCHGRLNNYFKAYGFHALHGRAIPLATGIKLANPRLNVAVIGGDGDAYSIGLGHFIHAARRNINLTYIVVNNMIYGLTQGQTSPTSRMGFTSISTPFGSKESPLDGPQLALAAQATFIARGYSGDSRMIVSLMEQGFQHQGFALIEILSPCVTHNKINTYEWFKEHTFKIEKEDGYEPRNREAAWKLLGRKEKFALGLLYREEKPSYDDLVIPGKRPLIQSTMEIDFEKIDTILKKFE
jgi:2-oxoglutarate ferredoxin oxidoreductase subunit beta